MNWSVLKIIENHVQGRTLAGLVALVPLIVTIVVLFFIIQRADDFVFLFIRNQPWAFTGIGLVALIIFCYLIGLLIAIPLGRAIMGGVSRVLRTIPVVKTIFGVTEQATAAVTSQFNFSRVVFLEWPRQGMAAIGFLTGHMYSSEGNRSIAIVYIPTVPNPTSGNIAIVPEDDLMETDLSVEDAMKLVFSGGIVLPESISLARVRNSDSELIGQFFPGQL